MSAVATLNKKAEYLEYLNLLCEQKRREKIKDARLSLWRYCQLQAPDFYTDSKWHLKLLCDTLQKLIEGKLINEKTGKPYKKLIIQMPPRHGKTRTLILFCSWAIGRDKTTSIITAGYNDTVATDFSKFTRNTIGEERNTEDQFIFNDVFPSVKLKQGDSQLHKWAVEGNFFNFMSSGKGGTITGFGGKILIVDDPVKGIEDAFNENQANKDWDWYTGTWISRMESDPYEIINHTPWTKQDISGRLQSGQDKDLFYVLSLPAYDGKEMLCPEILSKERFDYLSRTMNELIFQANYLMKRIDVKGLLYGSDWKVYTDLPRDENGKECFTAFGFWCDTADTGDDYLCWIAGKIYNGLCYVVEVYYTQDSVDITEPVMAELILKLQVKFGIYEGNSGGHAISNHVHSILTKDYKWHGTSIDYFTQTKNKESRILSNAKSVKERIIFPVDWMYRWPEFYTHVTTFLKKGKNEHDDGPDTLTQIVEYMDGDYEGHYIIKSA